MIKVKCPNADCGKVAQVKDEFAGKRAKCPACGTIMHIPNAAAPIEAAVQPPPSRRSAPPPMEEAQYDDYEEAAPRGRAPKSGQVTAIAIVNFVLGGLSVLAGACVSLGGLLFGGLSSAASNSKITVQGMTPEQAEQFRRDMAKLQAAAGGSLAWVATLLVIMGIVSLIWGAAAIADGVGVLNRKNWGRMLALILAGIAGVLALVSIVLGIMGGGIPSFVNGVLYLAYAGWVFSVMLNKNVAREFS
jgi:hypothetical protein